MIAEADLLKRIEAVAALQRRKALKATQAQRELTTEERSEFAQLTDEIELAEAGRIDLLSELATLRGITLPEVARQLGLGRPSSLAFVVPTRVVAKQRSHRLRLQSLCQIRLLQLLAGRYRDDE